MNKTNNDYFDFNFCMRNVCKNCRKKIKCDKKKRIKEVFTDNLHLVHKPFEELLKKFWI